MTKPRPVDACGLRVLSVALSLAACARRPPTADQPTGAAVAGALDAGADAPHTDAAPGFELPRNTSDHPNCIKLVVGTAREHAELCDDFDGDYWRATHQIVRVVRAGKTVTVLDVVTQIEGFDTGATMLETRLRVAADGMSATVVAVPAEPDAPEPTSGHPSEDCKNAPPTPDDEATERATHGRPTYGELRRRLCGARGRYRWAGGRFVR